MHLRFAAPLLLALLAAAPARSGERDLRVTTGSEVLALPEFLMRSVFEHARPGAVVVAGADLRWTRGPSEWSVGLGGGTILSRDGIWTVKQGDLDDLGGWYQEMDMDVLLLWAGGEWGTPLGRGVSLRYGAQLGMAVLLGEIYATELIPGCDGPPGECGHWRSVTRHPVSFSPRVMPLLGGHLGLRYEAPFGVLVQLDAGLRDLPFVGLRLGWNLGPRP